MSADAPSREALFAALDATWPAAEFAEKGGWRLRRGEGGGQRVSAATRTSPEARIEDAEAAMAAWGQAPIFRMTPEETALDEALAARGYEISDPSLIYVAEAAPMVDPRSQVARVITGEGRVALMEEIWAAGGIGPARLAVMDRVQGPRRFLFGRIEDRPAAVAFVAVSGSVAMLHALETHPGSRRKGAGRMLTAAAARVAVENGAQSLALAVTERNAAARGLYSSLGMSVAAGYHYRVKRA